MIGIKDTPFGGTAAFANKRLNNVDALHIGLRGEETKLSYVPHCKRMHANATVVVYDRTQTELRPGVAPA